MFFKSIKNFFKKREIVNEPLCGREKALDTAWHAEARERHYQAQERAYEAGRARDLSIDSRGNIHCMMLIRELEDFLRDGIIEERCGYPDITVFNGVVTVTHNQPGRTMVMSYLHPDTVPREEWEPLIMKYRKIPGRMSDEQRQESTDMLNRLGHMFNYKYKQYKA